MLWVIYYSLGIFPVNLVFTLWDFPLVPNKGFHCSKNQGVSCLCAYPEPKQCQPSRPAQKFGVGKQSHYRTSSVLYPERNRVSTHALLKGHLEARLAAELSSGPRRLGLKSNLTRVCVEEKPEGMDWLLFRNIYLVVILMVSRTERPGEKMQPRSSISVTWWTFYVGFNSFVNPILYRQFSEFIFRWLRTLQAQGG